MYARMVATIPFQTVLEKFLIQLSAVEMPDLIPLKAATIPLHSALAAALIAAQVARTTLRNVSLCFHARIMPATSAAIAMTTRPIGLADSAALRSHCTAVQAIVAARTTPIAIAPAATAIRFATTA